MVRLVPALALLVATLASMASPASACCHIYEIEEAVGPCGATWEGDGFHGRTDRVAASCTVAGETVGYAVERCVGNCE